MDCLEKVPTQSGTCYGGMINVDQCSHVIAAVQAILHNMSIREVLLNDDRYHRKSCRSLLNCMACSFFNLMESVQKNGIGNPTFFVAKWKDISLQMTDDKKKNAYEVLCIFLLRLRMGFAERIPNFTLQDLHDTCISHMFEGAKLNQAYCDICGPFPHTTFFLSVELLEENEIVFQKSIYSVLWKEEKVLCVRCCRVHCVLHPIHVTLPRYLIVCCKWFNPTFKLELMLKPNPCSDEIFAFQSCIIQVFSADKTHAVTCLFITMCPDGRFRKFEDSVVSFISPAKLVMFMADVSRNSRITLIYMKSTPSPTNVNKIKKTNIQGKVNSHRLKFVSFPRLDQNFETSDIPNTATIGTQTESNNVTASCQTDTLKEVVFLSYEDCCDTEKFQLFTGLSKEDFKSLFNLLGGDQVIRNLKRQYREDTPKKVGPSKISSEDRLFMFLLRLRRGLPLEELSFSFKISVSYVGELLYVMTRHIYLTFKAMEKEMFISAAHQRKNKPNVMKPFKNLRIILDGASFMIEKPSNFEQQGNSFSSYKSHNVGLVQLGISCEGATIFCSEAFEGSISDKEAIIQSGLLDSLSKGDGVMSDRGYDLTAELKQKGCFFYKPPSKGDRNSLTAEEEILTKALAAARIYCEHAIADIKDNRLLQGVIPLTLLPVLSDLIYIAAYLRNFSPSRILNRSFVVKENESNANACAMSEADASV